MTAENFASFKKIVKLGIFILETIAHLYFSRSTWQKGLQIMNSNTLKLKGTWMRLKLSYSFLLMIL